MRSASNAQLSVVVRQRTPPVAGCEVQHRASRLETLPPSVLHKSMKQAPAAAKFLVPLGRGPKLVSRIASIFGAHKRQYLPKIVRIFDDRTEWRHRPNDTFTAYAPIAAF
jgi:hypothetical protein